MPSNLNQKKNGLLFDVLIHPSFKIVLFKGLWANIGRNYKAFYKIYVAGHHGMVGSVIVRQLAKSGYENIVTRTELDLCNQWAVQNLFTRT